MTIGGTIRWSSPFLLDPFRVMKQAAGQGLKIGAPVAHGPLGALTICSAARPDREFTEDEIAAIKAIVTGPHDHTAPTRSPTPDQHATLDAMAAGRTPEEAASDPGLTPDTACARFRRVCTDLFVRTPAEAVARARSCKLL